jgi:hypothetical protein
MVVTHKYDIIAMGCDLQQCYIDITVAVYRTSSYLLDEEIVISCLFAGIE